MTYAPDPFDTGRLLSLVKAGDRVLDLGCSTGNLTLEIAARGAFVTGLELSQARAEQARRAATARGLGSRATFVQGDFTRPVAILGTFDLVAAIRSMTCIVEPQSLEATLSTIWDLLRPDGIVYIADFHCDPTNPAYADRYVRGVERGLPLGSFESAAFDGSRFVAHHYRDEEIEAMNRPYERIELVFNEGRSLNGNRCSMFELVGRKVLADPTTPGTPAR